MSEETLAIYGALLVALVVLVGVPAVAVYRENSDLTMRRGPFIAWVAVCVIVLPVVFGVVESALPGLATSIVLMVAIACILYVFYQRLVRRARDAGMGKRIAYIGVIPLASLVVPVILMIVRSASPGEPAQAAEA